MGDLFINNKLIGFTTDEVEISIGKPFKWFDNFEFTVPIATPLPGVEISPELLGIYLPGLTRLGIDGCVGQGAHYDNGNLNTPYGALGHAHICPLDPDIGMVCTRKEYLKNADGTYSGILLHELAHVLTIPYYHENIKLKTCGPGLLDHEWSSDSLEAHDTSFTFDKRPDAAHCEAWKEWARKLGVDPTPWGYPPYPRYIFDK